MSNANERYSRLFALAENLYCCGAPVAIAAGVLQKDNQSGRVFVQLKLYNLQAKQIKAASVKIYPQDTIGQPLGEPLEHQYLDLSVQRDDNFGSQTPVMMPEAKTRAFAVSVQEVIFADNSVWQAAPEAAASDWQPLPSATPLLDELKDPELYKQFQMKFGGQCRWKFAKHADLWRCTCGAWNLQAEETCHSCQLAADALAEPDLQALAQERNERLAAEAKQAEQRAAERAAQTAKIKKIAKVAVPLILLLIVAVIFFNNAKEKRETYDKAMQYLNEGNYSLAVRTFSGLGGYKDSKEQLENAKTGLEFDNAVHLLKARDYEEAYAAFGEIGDWGQAPDYLARFQYVLRQENLPDGSRVDYYYNDDGSISHTEKNGRTTGYEYNSDGTLRSIEFSNYPNRSISTYYYNSDGVLKKEVACDYYRSHKVQEVAEEYVFENGDKPSSKKLTATIFSSSYPYKASSVYSSTASLSYDAQGRLTEERTVEENGTANVYTFEYDQHDNMTKRSWQKLGAGGELLNSNEETYAYEYDEDGHMLSKTTNGDQKITYSYGYFFVDDPEFPLEH